MKKNTGYTLVEVLIVITMLGIIMPAIFSILFAILQQQAKISEVTEVKREGDYILQFMKEKIAREAVSVVKTDDGVAPSDTSITICKTPTATVESPATGEFYAFETSIPSYFYFQSNGTSLEYHESLTTSLNDPTRVSITDFSISCVRKSAFAPPMVLFAFTAEYNRASPNDQLGVTSMRYQSRVQLRTGDSN